MNQEPEPCCLRCRHWTQASPYYGHCTLVKAYLAIGYDQLDVGRALQMFALSISGLASPITPGPDGWMHALYECCEYGYEPRT